MLDDARASKSSALVIRGDPGIGKSALLEDTRDRAGDMHVLAARGVESECELPWAALHQLLRPALGEVDRLPEPQAAALRSALGLVDGAGDERFLVFAACLSLLSELADRRPVLCLVDDAHWLDSASADALRFVARRLDAEGIVMLFAAREREILAFDAPDLASLVLRGLDPEASSELLARGAGVEAAPSVRERLLEQTHGNALALLEVPSVLTDAQLAGDEPLPETLPMTDQVETVFLERVRRLPAEVQRFLLIAASDDTESAALVSAAATATGVGADALDAAEHAGLIVVRGSRLEFRHPLVRSAVYEAATSTERRSAHRALAEALGGDDADADRRAWHLSASVLEPDESVVTGLEEAAARAKGRGAYLSAAKALERAAELSADDTARGRRLIEAASAASEVAADARAVALARQALPLVDDLRLRAEVTRVLAVAEINRGWPRDAADALVESAETVGHVDPRQALELLMNASHCASEAGDFPLQIRIGEVAASIEPPTDDQWSRFMIDLLDGCRWMVVGNSERGIPLLRQAVAWADATGEERGLYVAAACSFWFGDDVIGSTLAHRAAELARTRGAARLLSLCLGLRASQLFFAQRFDEASAAATEAVQIARELKADNLVLLPLTMLSAVAAVRGREEEARAHAGEVLQVGTARGLANRVAGAHRALGYLELAQGRWDAALEHLLAVAELRRDGNVVVAMLVVPDTVEAAVRADKPDEARSRFAEFEAWSEQSEAAWARPLVASCRALFSRGEETTAHFEEALRHRRDARPLDLARIRLLYGEHLRRERRRIDARKHLRAALEGFEGLGAEPWAERARAELRASGETARKRDPSTIDQLTPQELQIARYVAEGLTNKEIAARFFLSRRTIDSHMRNIFAKLAITSRVQLAQLPLDVEEPDPAEVEASPA